MKRTFITLILTGMLCTANTFAQEGSLPLYNGKIPNSKPTPADYTEILNPQRGGYSQVSEPTLLPFFPEKGKANGTAVVICPGGGYSFLAYDKEGIAVAKKFNAAGVTAFVLKYRLPNDKIMQDRSIGPLQDAQRALQMVRENAAKWNIDVNKVGILGFSAGGHLAATATTHFEKPVIDTKNGISVRPDFSVLVYPVVSMGTYTHKGSKNCLIGESAGDATVKLYSNETQVTPNTPPVFLVHAQDDKDVPVQNSLMFFDAMTANHVKGSLNVYQAGGHGYGLNNKTTTDEWFTRCLNWMAENKWL